MAASCQQRSRSGLSGPAALAKGLHFLNLSLLRVAIGFTQMHKRSNGKDWLLTWTAKSWAARQPEEQWYENGYCCILKMKPAELPRGKRMFVPWVKPQILHWGFLNWGYLGLTKSRAKDSAVEATASLTAGLNLPSPKQFHPSLPPPALKITYCWPALLEHQSDTSSTLRCRRSQHSTFYSMFTILGASSILVPLVIEPWGSGS